jgi:hypothetical protein
MIKATVTIIWQGKSKFTGIWTSEQIDIPKPTWWASETSVQNKTKYVKGWVDKHYKQDPKIKFASVEIWSS